MSNILTMTGDKARTPADVVNELNELVAKGEVKNILVVTTRPNDVLDVDWSHQSMKELSYSVHVAQHNMMVNMGRAIINE